MQLDFFFESIYLPRRLRGKSPRSVDLYRMTLRQFARTLGRPPCVSDLTEETVLRHLARRSDVSPATRNKELNQLAAMWRLACRRGMLAEWPDIRHEREPERTPVAWMPDELERLLRSAESAEGVIGDVPAGRWWGAFVRVALDTGERISAMLQSRWDGLHGAWLDVSAEARKGKTRDRRYRLSDATVGALALLRPHTEASERLFPWPYAPTYIWSKYRQIVQKAGLPTGRKYQLHCLRKTMASVIYAAGLDPQEALDHSDRRTTAKYIDPRFSRTRQPCDVLTEWLAKPKRKRDDDQRDVG